MEDVPSSNRCARHILVADDVVELPRFTGGTVDRACAHDPVGVDVLRCVLDA